MLEIIHPFYRGVVDMQCSACAFAVLIAQASVRWTPEQQGQVIGYIVGAAILVPLVWKVYADRKKKKQ
jgi:hypothetical protein